MRETHWNMISTIRRISMRNPLKPFTLITLKPLKPLIDKALESVDMFLEVFVPKPLGLGGWRLLSPRTLKGLRDV